MMTVFAQEWSIKLRPSWTSILHLPRCYGYPSRKGLAGIPNPIYSSVWRKWLSAVCAVAPMFILHFIIVFCAKGIKVAHLLGGGEWSTLHTMLGVKIPTATWMVKTRAIMMIMTILGLIFPFYFCTNSIEREFRQLGSILSPVTQVKRISSVTCIRKPGQRMKRHENTQHTTHSTQFTVHSHSR